MGVNLFESNCVDQRAVWSWSTLFFEVATNKKNYRLYSDPKAIHFFNEYECISNLQKEKMSLPLEPLRWIVSKRHIPTEAPMEPAQRGDSNLY